MRAGLALEVLPGEALEVRPAASIEFVDGPGGDPPTIDGATVRCAEIGRYHFVIDGKQDLHVCAFEQECLAHIEANARGTGHGLVAARNVLRSLATHAEWFHGHAESLVNRSLAAYGG